MPRRHRMAASFLEMAHRAPELQLLLRKECSPFQDAATCFQTSENGQPSVRKVRYKSCQSLLKPPLPVSSFCLVVIATGLENVLQYV
jgi:hypothetical protein